MAYKCMTGPEMIQKLRRISYAKDNIGIKPRSNFQLTWYLHAVVKKTTPLKIFITNCFSEEPYLQA